MLSMKFSVYGGKYRLFLSFNKQKHKKNALKTEK